MTVLVGALRADAPRHDLLRGWLEDAVADPEVLGLTDAVLGGTVRVLTHPRVFDPPSPLPDVLDAVAALRAAHGVERVTAGPRHWEIVDRLCRLVDARGDVVPHVQHAAVALEHGALWVSLDRAFARFPGLRWATPEGPGRGGNP
ncbi:TA system VapC family ribonuclease toxin [Cellulomonas marina]|uniref:TA system VapC family ribonuclease toxin n=1 Tax=Cellulomonas marina TaxID=988821 RepID=UPI001EF256FB|nr:TA system VapC family ribonuclease toxin [Cellulomonas marina]